MLCPVSVFVSMCGEASVSIHAHVSVFVCASGSLCFAACVPPAWGQSGPRTGQLEAQSVEGVRGSVVGGRPDPQQRPDHLPWLPL